MNQVKSDAAGASCGGPAMGSGMARGLTPGRSRRDAWARAWRARRSRGTGRGLGAWRAARRAAMRALAMNATLAALIRQLDLERLEANLFRGQSRDLGGRSVFGGQVIGQALAAAERTVEGRTPHSLHAYFLLPGD